MEAERILRFKTDTKQRKQWFTGVSFSHPAKMSLPLQQWIIENYTKEGETILDPMAGSGTVLVACSLGRNVIAIELESKFVDIIKGNWEKIKQRGPMMGYQFGQAQIIQGDARNLEHMFSNLSVGAIITSPPYAEAQTGGGIAKKGYQGPKHTPTDLVGKRSYMPENAGGSNGQIGNLPYGRIDSIITSPPYEASVTGRSGIDWTKATRGAKENWKPRDRTKEPSHAHLAGQGQPFNYSESHDNIGNLKSSSYLEAMYQVYCQCHSVLRDGGLMILVTKNFIRNLKVVHLDYDTIHLCEKAGFRLLERHYRKLPAQSFWRIIYQQKHPDVETIEHEDVLIFKRQV